MRRYEGPLTRYAARIIGDAELARDVVQETFLRLCAGDQARIQQHLAQWLFTVCRNRAMDVRRKDSRMRSFGDAQLAGYASPDPDPSDVLAQREAVAEVLRVLETIPLNQQEVIRLKFQNGLTYREISHVTGLSVSNVGFLIHVGLKAVRKRLGARDLTPKT